MTTKRYRHSAHYPFPSMERNVPLPPLLQAEAQDPPPIYAATATATFAGWHWHTQWADPTESLIGLANAGNEQRHTAATRRQARHSLRRLLVFVLRFICICIIQLLQSAVIMLDGPPEIVPREVSPDDPLLPTFISHYPPDISVESIASPPSFSNPPPYAQSFHTFGTPHADDYSSLSTASTDGEIEFAPLSDSLHADYPFTILDGSPQPAWQTAGSVDNSLLAPSRLESSISEQVPPSPSVLVEESQETALPSAITGMRSLNA